VVRPSSKLGGGPKATPRPWGCTLALGGGCRLGSHPFFIFIFFKKIIIINLYLFMFSIDLYFFIQIDTCRHLIGVDVAN
jgi:hypothetical protein